MMYIYKGREKFYVKTCMNITMVYDFTVRFLKDMAICGKKVLIKSIIIVNTLLKVKYMLTVKCVKKYRE